MMNSKIKIHVLISTIIITALVIGCSGTGNGGGTLSESSKTKIPVISPVTGEITNHTEISISAEDGAVIYYTTDGTVPTSGSNEYTGTFTLPADTVSQTVMAIAILDGLSVSETVSTDYLVYESAASVAFSAASGALPDNTEIVLSSVTENAVIYYTIDGGDPTEETPLTYSAPFTMASLLAESLTIKAYASADGIINSPVTSVEYAKAVAEIPVSDRLDGESISDTMTVSLTTGTENASIYYSLDGSEPSNSSALYTAPFTLSLGSVIVKAVAILDGYTNSEITTINLKVDTQAEVPVIVGDSGFIHSGATVTLSTSSSETIYYTLDGSNPEISGIEYTGAITINQSLTLRAYAAGNGYYPSNEAVAEYTVYETLDGLAPDTSALAAIASNGSVAVRSGGDYYMLDSGSFGRLSLTISEPSDKVLDFVLDDSGVITALYLDGSNIIYWTSSSGTIATVNTTAVSLADACILIDSNGNTRIVFAQYYDENFDEVVEAVYNTSGSLDRASSYVLNNRARGLDAALDSTGMLAIAASNDKNDYYETIVIAWNENTSGWDTLKGWTNKSGNPALAVRSDDSLILAYVNPVNTNTTRFNVFDITAAAALVSNISIDTIIDGDTNIVLDDEENIYVATHGYGWIIEDGSETALQMGNAPYRLLSDSSNQTDIYVLAAADLTLYAID